MKTWPG